MTILYIPTYRRLDRQKTWESIPGRWRSRATLVAPPDEVEPLRARGYPALACPAKGIGATRQWIMDQHDDGPFVMMMDDDLRFAKRRTDDWGKFTQLEDAGAVLDALLPMLEQVPLVGLANRSGANNVDPPVQMNGRMHDLMCLDTRVTRQHNIRFDDMELMEDFYVMLSLLVRGYPTALNSAYVKDNAAGANASGGCSVYRTQAKQEVAARALHARFPEFVALVEKKGWNGMGTRTDVRVSWAKAYQAGREGRDMLDVCQHTIPDWGLLEAEWLM